MKPQVVMSGVDSEYVLADLGQFLIARGYDVHELDFGKVKTDVRSLLSHLATCKTVYVTSAHTPLSLRSARIAAPVFAKLYPNYLAPIEIIPLLRPASSIFVPHDLLTPFGDTNLNELQFLDLYNHVLAPELTDELIASVGPNTKVHAAGWIKYNKHSANLSPIPLVESSPRISLFLTIIQHMLLKYGVEGFVEYLRPVLGPQINVKLPAWKGIEELEQRIRQETGANVIPASVSSIELIQASDVVICNSVSSILAEATMMGKPCICLLDSEGGDPASKKSKMSNFPDLIWHPYAQRDPIGPHVMQAAAASKLLTRIQPFDFGYVESLIERA